MIMKYAIEIIKCIDISINNKLLYKYGMPSNLCDLRVIIIFKWVGQTLLLKTLQIHCDELRK